MSRIDILYYAYLYMKKTGGMTKADASYLFNLLRNKI